MPTYTYRSNKTGATKTVQGPRPLTDVEVRALFGQAPPDDTPLPPLGSGNEPGLLGTIANNFKSPVRSAIELVNRPGEALTGLVSGTLQGGLGQGLKRGFDAAFEADLVNSKIEETGSKMLLENNILADSPKTRAAVGLLWDMGTDPTNLLGGAGFIRRGAMTGAKALGAGEKTARTLVGLPIADAFANKVIAPTGKAITQGVAKYGPEALAADAKLKLIVDPATGMSAFDMKRIAEGKKRAAQELIEREILGEKGAIFFDVPKKDRQILAYAREYPTSPEAARVASDPRLTDLLTKVAPRFDAIYKADVKSGLMSATKGLDLTDAGARQLKAMTPTQLSQLEQVIKTGAVLPLKSSMYKLADQLKKAAVRGTGADTVPIADLGTLKFVKNAKTGAVTAEVSSKMPNYLGHYVPGKERPASIFRDVNPTLRESQQRATTLNEAVALGATDDIAEILTKRTQNSARATIDKKLIEDYTSTFGKATNAVGLDRLSPSTLSKLPDALKQLVEKTPYLPAEVVADLERYSIRVNDPDQMIGVFRQSTRLFRALATSMNLGTYQVNNFVGNVTNMYGSGMSMDQVIKEYWNAAGRINLEKTPRLLKTFTDPKGNVWTDANIMKAARENGIFGHVSGYTGELSDAKALTPTASMMVGPLNPDNKVYKGVADWSQKKIEDPAKLGMFIHELKQGRGATRQASLDRSVLNVKNTLFDYAELSDKERKLRMFVPFYTWTRKNLPLQVINLAKNPKSIANQGRLMDFARELAMSDDVPNVNETKLPDYMQEGNSFPIPGFKSNEGKAIMGSLKSPMMDLSLLSTDGQKTFENLAGRITPLKAPAEYFFNRNLETGREITSRDGYSDANLLSRLLGLGKTKADGTRIQPDGQKYLTDSIPVPFGSIARSMPYPGDKTAMPMSSELFLRMLGLAPQAVTSEMMKQARTKAKGIKSRTQARKKADEAYDRLDK